MSRRTVSVVWAAPFGARRGEHANPWGLVPFRVDSRLTGRGWLGVEAGVACEAGGGAGARRDHGDRGRVSRARRGGGPGRPRAEAQRGEAAHGGAPGRDGLGASGRRGRALPLVRSLRASAGQQRLLPCDVPLSVRRRAGPGPAVARLPLPGVVCGRGRTPTVRADL